MPQPVSPVGWCLMLGLLTASAASGEDSFVKYLSAKYSIQWIYLYASPIELLGADIDESKITSLATTGGFSALAGRTFPVHLRVEFYSLGDLLPVHYGSNQTDSTLEALSILFGFAERSLPSLKIERRKFQGQGITKEGFIFQRDGVELPPHSTFDLGTTVKSALLSWEDFHNLDESSDAKRRAYFAFGIANVEFLGVRQNIDDVGSSQGPTLVDQTLGATGLIVQLNASLFPSKSHGTFRRVFEVENEWILTEIGGSTKGGFKLSWLTERKNLRASFYIGLHGWRFFDTKGLEFGTADTSMAPSLGVMIVRGWSL